VGSHGPWVEAVGNQLQQNLGVTPTFTPVPLFADYLGQLDAETVTGLFRLGWVMDYPSPQNYLEPLHSSGGSSNNTGYSNPEVDELITQGNQAASVEEGITFYNQAEDIILDEMPIIPMWFGLTQGGHSENVDNVVIDAFTQIGLSSISVVNP
jgi:ABC-type oligopeptide transport system substrate-binding subunit